ncbi:hypothetical protein BV898_04673 [Hypsibius exemplaris]|uniref:Uncharacterized protein n=1 Tax=Hypsibius exemplaris TaxID=2072580 RepID=A0A1W0X1W7_HYPEX|nr:hypothetical protein BV898_04673 [Hypsibius exemplaris]
MATPFLPTHPDQTSSSSSSSSSSSGGGDSEGTTTDCVAAHLSPCLSVHPHSEASVVSSGRGGVVVVSNCDREASGSSPPPASARLEPSSASSCCISVSPSPSTTSTSTSSLFFGSAGPASSLNSLNSSFCGCSTTSTSEADSSSKSDRESLSGGGGGPPRRSYCGSSRGDSATATKVALQPTGQLSLRQPRMGQATTTTTATPKCSDPLSRTRLKDFNQPTEGLPHRVRLLDGEEHGLPEPRRSEYSGFRLNDMEGMNNVISAPPNRTVDHSVCENFSYGHRCMGDAGCLPPCPPPYGSHLGEGFTTCSQKKHSDSSSSSSSWRSGKIKEVIKSMFDRVVRSPESRNGSDSEEKAAKAAARSSSETRCLARSKQATVSEPVTVLSGGRNSSSNPRRTSPQARLPNSASARTGAMMWRSSDSGFDGGGAPPTYDAVMKESTSSNGKPKRK